jgi:hypothetical protein
MGVFATVIIANKNKTTAQELTSSEMFTTELKKGINKYWVSSGVFSDKDYNSLVESGLIHTFNTDSEVKPLKTISLLGFKMVHTEED